MKKALNILFLLFALSFLGFSTTSCSIFQPKQKSNDELFGQGKKKKKKLKKCKIESCHVRMNHGHEGSEFKGKRCFLFTTLFAPKQPKYGEGLPKNATKRDPHQHGKKTKKW